MESVSGPSRQAAGDVNSPSQVPEQAASQGIYHTVTACTRCRQRKTKCDPTIPRCKGCERVDAPCRYWDAAKGKTISRSYIIELQNKIKKLEKELADLEDDNQDSDPEELVRGAAAVRVREGDESKYLGPSSGIAMTRLVMQLAKHTTASKSIKSIVSDASALQVKDRFAKEGDKPTSKVYPLISSLPASQLPTQEMTTLLVNLFNTGVQTIYPILHEPTLTSDIESVYSGTSNSYQNFIVRMVIAIGMQKMDVRWAGLGDSYYLDALQYFEDCIEPMNLKTLQCFAMIALYSTLTPTRTAVYYLVGIGVRLIQALGYDEEATITQPTEAGKVDIREIDMRRRLFWAIVTMDYGFAHSLGRPGMLSTSQQHLNVKFFEPVPDEYITPAGLQGGTGQVPFSPRKWIAIHFFDMRLLQLEIRRTLYLKKRPTPKNEEDPWFSQMHNKLIAWRDASPTNDQGSGFGKAWFEGRYNTMVIFLFRPSPQIPRPTARAAALCYQAAQHNIHLQRKQIETKSVELTWIFTQMLFSYVNALLWSLAYQEIRSTYTRQEVQHHLEVAMESIQLASSRWPGVESALQLYDILIQACLRAYDKDGDVIVHASSPGNSSQTADFDPRHSHSASPTNALGATPPPPSHRLVQAYRDHHVQSQTPSSQNSPVPYQASPASTISYISTQTPPGPEITYPSPYGNPLVQIPISASLNSSFDPNSPYNPLPSAFADILSWNSDANMSPQSSGIPEYFTLLSGQHIRSSSFGSPDVDMAALHHSSSGDVLFGPLHQHMDDLGPNYGLSEQDQLELMQALETEGMMDIENMIGQNTAPFSTIPPMMQSDYRR